MAAADSRQESPAERAPRGEYAGDVRAGFLTCALRARLAVGLHSLDTVPGAVDLLRAASVFRTPVPVVALLFHLGRPDPTAAHTPDRGAVNEQIVAILQRAGVAVDDSLDLSALPTPLQQQIAPHLAELQQLPTPPLRAPDDLARVIEVCATASLLSVERTARSPGGCPTCPTCPPCRRAFTAGR